MSSGSLTFVHISSAGEFIQLSLKQRKLRNVKKIMRLRLYAEAAAKTDKSRMNDTLTKARVVSQCPVLETGSIWTSYP